MNVYKVRLFMDETYEVISYDDDDEQEYREERSEFQGSLADCDAWISLREKGYM